ncbi:NAD(P)H-hydrate dehydratase [Terribacillus sp. 179-K 1B1 HS]|uniref:NAD(P)H-hydrate dehydratase n=1 Tax=Terribacillus sp. 179-K 1B1 HS TaxID=3142388 RepID=UPI0039A3D158
MYIVTAKEMYEVDRYAMEDIGIIGSILMESAGRAIAERMKPLIGTTDRIIVLCGSGNNGGDGYVVARTLLNEGYDVAAVQVGRNLTADAAMHQQVYDRLGGEVMDVEADTFRPALEDADVIVDAMLGLGVRGKLKSPYTETVQAVNEADALVFAIDLPSGVPADDASDFSEAIFADHTFVIEAPKPSVFIQKTAPHYGKWHIVSIGLPAAYLGRQAGARIWTEQDVKRSFPTRQPFSHKGTHGKGFLIGGGAEMPGSVTMSSMAALRAGAGLLTVGTLRQVIPSVSAHLTEATFTVLEGENGVIVDTETLDVSAYDGIVVGMGMGRGEATAALTKRVLEQAEVPVLLDADGLHHIKSDLEILRNRQAPTILTPHPGEMAMLLDMKVPELLENPFELARKFAIVHQVHLVLKGTYTIITAPDGSQIVNTTGNPGLGKGGSGDVLSGILLAMQMQHENLMEAIANGVYIHGKAADVLVKEMHSQQDLLATDLMKGLAKVFRDISD